MQKMTSAELRDFSTLLLLNAQFDFLPHEYVNDARKRQRVMSEIYALPTRYQATLLARFYMGFPIHDIAHALDMNYVQATTVLLKAEVMLKERLEKKVGRQLPLVQVCDNQEPMLEKLYRAHEKEIVTREALDRINKFTSGLTTA